MIKQLIPYAVATVLMTSPWIMRSGAAQTQQLPAPVTTEQLTETNKPRRLQLNLNITSPEDLKVVEGQQVKVGEILTDRTKERERLIQQRQQLEITLDRLSIAPPEINPPPPVPPMAQLPLANYSQELSSIALAENTLSTKQLAVKLQRQKVEQLQSLKVPLIVIEHERAVLAQKVQEQRRTELELEANKSKLKSSQSDRAYKEYLHSLEMSKRLIDRAKQVAEYEKQLLIRANQERQREYQKAAVLAQIQGIDNAISLISQVKSPYAGVVRKIRWLPGNDNLLAVQLVIVPEGQRPTANSALSGVEPRLPGDPDENSETTLPQQQLRLPGNPDENSDRAFTGVN
ncbi:MAG: hypothetical protein F6K36_22755 [Symploca sp. SIO3C6]|nr:hypothetical protein [Symploca sp. SIO3C6]